MKESPIKIEAKDILVRVLHTPNPLAVKIVVNFPLKTEGKASFTQKQQTQNYPLLSPLFEIPGVNQLHVFENQIGLSHTGTLSFEEITPKIIEIVKQKGTDHNPDFEPSQKKIKKALSPEQLEVEKILDRKIRPGLQADGGDLEVVSFKDNKIEISYQGACGGCPSSYMDTLYAIENILRYELKNDKIEVYPV